MFIQTCHHAMSASAAGTQCRQSGVHCYGRDVYVSTRRLPRLFHPQSPWRTIWAHEW